MRVAKVLSAIAGVLIVLASLTMASVGTILLVAVDDSDGYFTAGPVHVSTDSAALVADDIDVILDEPMPRRGDFDLDLVTAKIAVESRNGKEVFIGVGPTDAVDAYLGDVERAHVEVFGHDVVLRGVAGAAAATPPEGQDFWVATTGNGNLVWDVDEGRWAVAVLNADGSAGVDVAVTAGVRIPFLRAIGVGILVGGLIGLIVGVLLTYFGVRRDRQPPPSAPRPPADPTKPAEPEPVTA